MLARAATRRAALSLRQNRRPLVQHIASAARRTSVAVPRAALAAGAPLTLAFAATTYARAEANHDAAIEAARIRAQRLADALTGTG